MFFAKPSSTNYEECINLFNELESEHFNSGNADVYLEQSLILNVWYNYLNSLEVHN